MIVALAVMLVIIATTIVLVVIIAMVADYCRGGGIGGGNVDNGSRLL